MAALKNLVPDFKAHLASLSREEMLKLLTDLIDDADGLSPKGMYYILRAAKVHGYTLGTEPPKTYTEAEALAKGRVQYVVLRVLRDGLEYWEIPETGELLLAAKE